MVVMASVVEPNTRRNILDQTTSSPKLAAPEVKLQQATRIVNRVEIVLTEAGRTDSREACEWSKENPTGDGVGRKHHRARSSGADHRTIGRFALTNSNYFTASLDFQPQSVRSPTYTCR